MKKYFNQIATVFVSSIVVVGIVSAATTISTNINTGGTLTVTGTSTLMGNVGIGTTTPDNLLNVPGLIDFDNLHFNTNIGYQAGSNILTSGTNNFNTALRNTFLGYQAGFASSTSTVTGGGNAGNNNTAIGYQSLYSDTIGFVNTAVGGYSLASTTSAIQNTALGFQSLQSNTTGGNNTGVGVFTLNANITGVDNTAVGRSALINSTSTTFDVAVGDQAGRSILTGSNSTFIGISAGFNASQKVDAVNSMALGANTYTTADNQVVIGNTSVTQTLLNGNVGIGTTTPSSLLQVATSTANATTSVEIGRAGQNKGSCLVMYDSTGAAQYLSVVSGSLLISSTSCK